MGNAFRPTNQSSDHQEERFPWAKNLSRITVREIQKQRSDSTLRKKPSLHRRAARKRSKRAPRSARARRRTWRKPSKPAGITPKTTTPKRHFAPSGRHWAAPENRVLAESGARGRDSLPRGFGMFASRLHCVPCARSSAG